MKCRVISGAFYQGVIAHFAYFDHIVCDKPVAPVNQLQSRLTLTDTAHPAISTDARASSTKTP